MSTSNKQLMTLEDLKKEKIRVQNQFRRQELEISKDIAFIQDNSGKIVLNTVKSAIFPATQERREEPSKDGLLQTISAVGTPGLLTIAKGAAPVLKEILLPFVITWGIKKAPKLLLHAFRKKK